MAEEANMEVQTPLSEEAVQAQVEVDVSPNPLDDDYEDQIIAQQLKEAGGENPDSKTNEQDFQSDASIDDEERQSGDPDFPDEEIQKEVEETPVEEVKPEDEPKGDSEEDFPKRHRVRASNPLEAQALEMKRSYPEMSLAECLIEVGADIPQTKEPEPTGKGEDAEVEEEEGATTYESVSAELEALYDQQEQAGEDYDMKEHSRLTREIGKMQVQSSVLRFQEERAKEDGEREAIQQEEADQVEFDKSFDDSAEKAAELYPAVTQRDSNFSLRMTAIDKALQENGDPLFNDPNKPMIISRMVAQEMGIAPSNAQPISAKPRPTTTRRTAPVQPASGASRTTTTSTNTKMDEVLGSIQTMEDYDNMFGGE